MDGRVLRVSLRAVKGTRQEVNTFHYNLVDSTWPAHDNNPQTLADLFRDNVIPKFKLLYKSAWSIQPVVIVEEKDPLNPTAPRSEWSSGTAGPGTLVTSDVLGPSGATTVASLKSAHIGRRFNGRLFIGGDHGNTWMTGNVWVSTALPMVQAFLDAIPREPDISVGVSPAGCNWSVYSRTQRAANLNPYMSEITSVVLHNDVHWLRTRAGI